MVLNKLSIISMIVMKNKYDNIWRVLTEKLTSNERSLGWNINTRCQWYFASIVVD